MRAVQAVSEDLAVDRKAFQERSCVGTKMLFECNGRSAKIEIGNAQKEGEYSLTSSFQSGPARRHSTGLSWLRRGCCCRTGTHAVENRLCVLAERAAAG